METGKNDAFWFTGPLGKTFLFLNCKHLESPEVL